MSQKHDPDFDRGTVRYLASELEIPLGLAESGGAAAAAAMAELKKAHIAGSGMMRANHVAEAQKHIAALEPRRHGDLLQHWQAIVVTLGGTPQRTELAHVTPGEIVIPAELRTPELMAALRAVAEAQGIDLERYLVGSRRNSVNQRTGQPEFQDGKDIEEITVTGQRQYPNALGFFQLPQNVPNGGYYNYGTPKNGAAQFGRTETLDAIERTADQWKNRGAAPFGVGNMSLSDGSKYDGHGIAHQNGTGVDIRPIRMDGAQGDAGRVSWKDANYDRDATQQLVNDLRANGEVDKIYFNDPNIKRGATVGRARRPFTCDLQAVEKMIAGIAFALIPLSSWAAEPSATAYAAKSGIAEAIGLIESLGKIWTNEGRAAFGVGDLSYPDGAPLSTHLSTGDHTTGTAVDLRPVRKDGAPQGVSWRDPAYDRAATQRLVDIARAMPQVDLIIFNDPEIKGVQPYPGHDDHLHVRVKTVFKARN